MRKVSMKMVLTMALTVLFNLTAGAQLSSKMSPWLLKQYKQQQMEVKKNGGPLRKGGRPVKQYIMTLVQSTDDGQSIREKGGVVWQKFGNDICAAFLPMDSLGVMEQSSNIVRMEANKLAELTNDTSATIIGVDKVWEGPSATSQLPQAFTGKGVVAAVMDVGFDFTHPAFRHDDGTSRIKWFWEPFAENDSLSTGVLGKIYTSSEEVLAAQHSEDAFTANHGSHVLGSMAGDGLNGRYVGMAPEADIIGAHAPLNFISDEFLDRAKVYLDSLVGEELDSMYLQVEFFDAIYLVELKKIFDAADSIGEPCVVNWSFGGSSNFFTDNTLFENVFNQLVGPGHIVLTSAGNSGDYFTYLKKEAGTPLDHDIYWASLSRDFFFITMRTEPDEPFFDFSLTFDGIDDLFTINTQWAYEASLEGKVIYLANDQIRVQMKCYLGAYGKYVYEIVAKPLNEYAVSNKTDDMLKVHGKIFIDSDPQVELMGGSTAANYVVFNTDNVMNSRGCHQGTISDLGSMERVIAVGAMHHRSQFTNIVGEQNTTMDAGSEEGSLVAFSSCGPTIQGMIKPDVVAPGHNILSAYNSFYSEGSEEETEAAVAPLTVYKYNEFDKDYAMWAMSGTSMSCPTAAGVVALWLQAKPDLTPEEIMGVIARTSIQPEPDFSGTDKNVYYGWGEIDAYAGLLDVLDLATNVPELSRHQPAGVSFRLSGRTLYIDGADNTKITIYDLSGRPVLNTITTNGAVELSQLGAGVYAVQIGRLGSTLIRL